MSHTKGPWERRGVMVIGNVRGEHGCLADVVCVLGSNTTDYPNMEEDQRLIAAAPDMLEALEWWLRCCGDDSVDNMHDWIQETWKRFDAVVDKAKGE